MISPGQIAFDIDGVFADTMALFLEIARKDYGINHIKYSDITRYYLEECLDIGADTINTIINSILEGDFEPELEPIEGSSKVLSDIAEKGPLLFVTARPALTPIKDWVDKMLPESPFPNEVVATGALEAKADVLKERGIRYFVEDCLEVCLMLDQRDITPILFHQPWNRSSHPFLEVRNWVDIRGLVDLHSS
jgi:5'(3')-deoxyribonucleotidase